jgi:diguanylate cyclase
MPATGVPHIMSNTEKRYGALSQETAQDFMAKAVDFLREHKLAPHPINFMVAYEYARGEDRDLVQEMNVHIERRLGWDDAIMASLFDRVVESLREDPFTGVSSELTSLLSNLLGQVQDARSSMAGYHSFLSETQSGLKGKDVSKGLQALVSELMSATNEVVVTTGSLQEQLDSTQREAEALRKQLDEIRREAEHDALTGALNRKALENILDNLVQGADINDKPFSLLVADVDHFKHFNDSYGHLLGDEVLKRVVQVMDQQVKGGDYIARYGGEEFMVILPETPPEGAVTVAEAIRQAVEKIVLVRRSTKERLSKVTISLGAGTYRRGEGKLSLVERVDSALYSAKHEGRNRVARAI